MGQTRITAAHVATAIGALLFIASEFSKDSKDRMLLSKDSKIASAIGELLSL